MESEHRPGKHLSLETLAREANPDRVTFSPHSHNHTMNHANHTPRRPEAPDATTSPSGLDAMRDEGRFVDMYYVAAVRAKVRAAIAKAEGQS